MSIYDSIPTINTSLGNYQRFMNLGIGTPATTEAYPSVFNFGGTGYQIPSVFNFGGNQSNLDQLDKYVDKGILSGEEAKNLQRRSLGLPPEKAEGELDESDLQESVKPLSGKTLEKARKSKNGAYEVNDAQTQVAENLVESAKNILENDPSKISEADVKQLKEIFSYVSKNPMIADAFVTAANSTSFKGHNSKTTTLLGSYQQTLTKFYGKDDAKEMTEKVLETFKTAVSERNATEFNTFNTNYSTDVSDNNIQGYSFLDVTKRKFQKHPVATSVVALGVLGAGFGICKIPVVGPWVAGALVVGGALLGSAKTLLKD